MRAARTDANQAEIVQALRAAGCFVMDDHEAGKGRPDIWAWHPGAGWKPMEIKAPGGLLTPRESEFHASCPVPIDIVRSAEEALAVMGLIGSDGSGYNNSPERGIDSMTGHVLTQIPVPYDVKPKFARFVGECAYYTPDSSTEFIHRAFIRRYGYDCEWIEASRYYIVAGPIRPREEVS